MRAFYDCRKCENSYKRPNGKRGCNIIDDPLGKYPIITINDTDVTFAHCTVCREYKQKNPPLSEVPRAKRILCYPRWNVAKCGNCGKLMYQFVTVCPHCSAKLEV